MRTSAGGSRRSIARCGARPRRDRSSILRLLAVLLFVGVPVTEFTMRPAAAGTDSIEVTGRGYGHGRGMGQYGAFGYATGVTGTPWTSAQILDHFYGGTQASTVPASTEMTVRILSRDGAPTVVTGDTGTIAVEFANGQTHRSTQPYVRFDVSGSNSLKLYEGSSCSGPWSGVGTVSSSSATATPIAATENAFSFGVAADVGVTGDWNGDGSDTVGVFRSGRWYLRNENTPGEASISISFGRGGDVPVVGDWNGDGRDSVGVRRGNRFYLRDSLSSGVADRDYSFGVPSDVPVAGDWDGDGTDTIGVARDATFYVRNSHGSGDAHDVKTLSQGGNPLAGAWAGGGVDSVGNRAGQRFRLLVATGGASTGLVQLCTTSGRTTYRGSIRAVNHEGQQRTVSVLPLEQFLRGVVPAESPASWGDANGGTGMAALEAQAVAARSFAVAENRYPYAKSCDTISCQVYRGTAIEHPNTDRAIAATSGVVRRFTSNGAVARTEFSSSTGGRTVGTPVSPFEGVVDEGDATPANARHEWRTEITLAQVGSAFCGGAAATSVRVTERLAEDGFRRAKTVRVGCPAGATDVTGDQFRFGLGLFSSWFYLDGEGLEDQATGPGIFRSGEFHLRATNDSGAATTTVSYGPATAVPVAGDWDGDGIATIGYRSGQEFHLRNANSSGGDHLTVTFGRSSDVAVVGDVDGDGDDDIGVRRGDQLFFATDLPSNKATVTITVGELVGSDVVVFGDWDGDGTDEVGWLRGTTFHLGSLGSVGAPQGGTPVVVRLPGTERDTVGVVAAGAWRVLSSPTHGASVLSFQYGTSGDVPVTGRWFS